MFSRHRDQKLIDHFIYAEGIDIRFFENNHSRYLGQNVPWRFCTHMSNVCTLHIHPMGIAAFYPNNASLGKRGISMQGP